MLTKEDKAKLKNIFKVAKNASLQTAQLDNELKNKILISMADALIEGADFIIAENKKDLDAGQANGLSKALLDRLELNQARVEAMAKSVREIAAMDDPVGESLDKWDRPNGMVINKVSVPIGVIAIIYEARPNVTSDCVALCLKSSNIVILRGGSDAFNSNMAVVKVLKAAAAKHTDLELFFFVDNTQRESVDFLLKKGLGFIDLVIPRGGKGLIKKVVSVSRIPVIKHYEGICHVFVDQSADLNKAADIAFNAKVQRPSVCNAMECLLVHKKVADEFLPMIAERYKQAGVTMLGCKKTCEIIGCAPAKSSDFGKEFLDLTVAIRVVTNVNRAVDHVNKFGSGHTDSIVSDTQKNIDFFVNNVQSACAFANLSTRFSDGGEFGLGAEMGISTDKLHARGPMGVKELTTYKYVVTGDGQIRT